jgi:ketosteroid isomerase-like protein
MQKLQHILPVILSIILFTTACSTSKSKTSPYKPDSQELYDAILLQDSVFFNAYNNCDLVKQAATYSDTIEFYHDQGGLMTSKQELLQKTKENICGKVSRELVKGSVEVYPIKGFGAIEMGMHKFHNNTQPPGTPSHPSKFIIIWQQQNDGWKITRVVSLH